MPPVSRREGRFPTSRAPMSHCSPSPATAAMPPARLSGTRLFFTITHPAEKSVGALDFAPKAPPSNGLFVPLTASQGRDQ